MRYVENACVLDVREWLLLAESGLSGTAKSRLTSAARCRPGMAVCAVPSS
jgi:hypothetical protein